MSSILELTALELGRKIKAGEITSLQATEAVLEQKQGFLQGLWPAFRRL